MNPVDLNSHLSVLDGWLQCPQCSSEKIKRLEDFYYCEGCLAEFPIKRGIPDFRLFADPYISIRDEDEKSERIVGDGSCDFEQLIDRNVGDGDGET